MIKTIDLLIAMAIMACLPFQGIPGVLASNAYLLERQNGITSAPTATSTAMATESFTAVSECHMHGTDA